MKAAAPKTIYLSPYDHAFASGPVFQRPASASAARGLFETAADGDLLWRLFESYGRAATCGEGLRLGLNARIVSKNPDKAVRIGRDCAIRGILRCEPGGRIELGNLVYVGDGVIISAQQSVEIGELTLLAHGVQVFDNDSHPTDAGEREAHFKAILGVGAPQSVRIASAPVKIGRRCWIGFNSTIMKGVTIGDDSIVAACSVVLRDVPSGVVVAGNPARIVKSLSADDAVHAAGSGA